MPGNNRLDETWIYKKLHFYHIRSVNKHVVKSTRWNQEIQIPLKKQCDLMFQNLRKNLSKKHQNKLSKLEAKLKQALKKLFFQPSEDKVVAFKKRYLEILAEGDVIFKDDKAFWQDYIRPVLIDFANTIVNIIRFCLSIVIPPLRNYNGTFFSASDEHTHEEASDIWSQEVTASQDKFHEIAEHAATLS
ncbi:MAG: hypothetical protein P1U36_00920 [Legionellaceae bacterium]|nr:hypothetical protein [Legionellaceae bacterium]